MYIVLYVNYISIELEGKSLDCGFCGWRPCLSLWPKTRTQLTLKSPTLNSSHKNVDTSKIIKQYRFPFVFSFMPISPSKSPYNSVYLSGKMWAFLCHRTLKIKTHLWFLTLPEILISDTVLILKPSRTLWGSWAQKPFQLLLIREGWRYRDKGGVAQKQ